ncbi:MAG: ABC transporter permease [Opitutaceae bacterium]|jgi:ABC-2 type transport system permease protein|nr:ABC transporter permease [Opitutaceae bacterium]
MNRFSPRRFWAIVLKEFIQMRRDRATFAMIIGIPVVQLLLFGYAINSDPRHLPTLVLDADGGPYARALVQAMRHSDYFNVLDHTTTETDARKHLQLGKAQFVLNIPVDFSRRLLRGERPAVLLEADATDPAATAPALAAMTLLMTHALAHDLPGPLTELHGNAGPLTLLVHRHYNPENITQYNTVPGLMGVVLTMTMVIITALAITRERERGTMETLLATPARPLEVLTGKILPYIAVGYIQMTLVLGVARHLFNVPLTGNLPLLYAVALLFIVANLSVGITFSTLAKNQLQAVQMAVFFFLPSLLLSGFMFPFRGMPAWAQTLGNCLPLTHFLRIARGVLLKNNDLADIAPETAPIALFLTAMMTIALKRYRRTLD